MAGRGPQVPGKGPAPYRSTSYGHITASQVRYYGAKGLHRFLGLPRTANTYPTFSDRDLANYGIREVDGKLLAGITSRVMRRDMAYRFQDPATRHTYQQWATAYPTMDPRAWLPLADYRIKPSDPEAAVAFRSDKMRQFLQGTAGSMYGPIGALPDVRARAGANGVDPGVQNSIQALNAITPADQVTTIDTAAYPSADAMAANAEGEDEDARRQNWQEGIDTLKQGGVPTADLPVFQGAHEGDDTGFLGRIEDYAETAVGAVQNVGRLGLTAAFAPGQYLNALARSELGNTDKQYDVARAHGLNEIETRVAFPDLVSGQNAIGQSIDMFQGRLPFGSLPDLDSLPPDRQKAILAAQKDWAEQQKDLPSIWDQIDIVQGVRHPEYLLDPSKGGSGWMPNARLSQELTDVASGRAFDVRSEDVKARNEVEANVVRRQGQAEKAKLEQDQKYLWAYAAMHGAPVTDQEKKVAAQYIDQTNKIRAAIDSQVADRVAQIVAPVGWTPGRGTAQIWMDSDTTEFQTISGIMDIGASVATDPLSYIPSGVAGRIAEHIPGTFAHAVAGKGDNVITKIATDQFAHRGASLARAGSNAPEAIAELRALHVPEYVLPGLKVNANGKVITPHTLVVMNNNFVKWVLGGKGQRVVHELAGMTSPTQIMRRANFKIDADLARMLAEANSPQAVIATLGTRIHQLRPDSLGRIGNFVGSTVLFKDKTLEDYGRLAGFDWLTGGTGNDSALRRMFREAPRATQAIDWRDTDTTVRQMYRWLNGIGVKGDDIVPHLDAVIAAGADRAKVYQALKAAWAEGAGRLASKSGISEKEAARLTRMFDEVSMDDLTAWATDGLAPGSFGQRADHTGQILLMDELLNGSFTLPDYRAARRAAGVMGAFRQYVPGLSRSGLKEVKSGPRAGQYVPNFESKMEDALNRMNSIWKYSVLVRGAYMLRNIGEMQMAAGFTGSHRSFFLSPPGFLAGMLSAAVSKRSATVAGRASKAVATPGVLLARYLERGERIPDNIAEALVDNIAMSAGAQKLFAGLDLNHARITGERMWGELGEEGADIPAILARGLSEQNMNLSLVDERIASSVAAKLSVATRNGGGAQREAYLDAYIERMGRLHGDPTIRDAVNPNLTEAERTQRFVEHNKDIRATMRSDLLPGDPGEDLRFVRGMEEVATAYHQADPKLMEALLTGKFDGVALHESKELRQYLSNLLDENPNFFNNAPPHLAYLDHKAGEETGWFQAMTNWFFRASGEVEDIALRVPVMRDAYIDTVTELAPHMTRAARAEAIGKARKAGDVRLARAIGRTEHVPGGTLNADAVDLAAQQAALRKVQETFYDAMRRQNWALAARLVSPFAQSWANTLHRWGRLSIRNPQMAYRVVKPLYALEQPGSGIIYKALGQVMGDESLESYYTPSRPDLSVDGFFYNNQYGDREFVYPGLGKLASLLPFLGVPDNTQFTSQMGSLNIAGEMLNPGTSPWIVLPASLVAEDLTYRDDPLGAITRTLFPFQNVPTGSLIDKTLQAFLPTVGRRFLNSMDDEANMNTIGQMMGTLLESGKYDVSDPKQRTQLIEDAREMATRVSMFAAVAGSLTPSTVQTVTSQAIDSGVDPRPFLTIAALATEFQKYVQNAPSYNEGLANFVTDFGDTALLTVLPKNSPTGVQSTNDVWEWRSEHPEEYKQYVGTKDDPGVLGLLFPGAVYDEEGSDFSEILYKQQRAGGETVKLTPEELLQNYTDKLARMAYNKGTADIAFRTDLTSADVAVANAKLLDEIREKFPGWSPAVTSDKMKKQLSTLDKLTRQADPDEALEQTPGWEYVKTYMAERRKAIAYARDEMGNSGNLGTKENTWLAEHLATVAGALMRVDDSGAFVNAWNGLLKYELAQVTDIDKVAED